MRPVVITPVKNSLLTVKRTIESLTKSSAAIDYNIFNDFSDQETEGFLREHQEQFGYKLINLCDHVDTPSPNYRSVLILAQKMALDVSTDLIIVESDVIVQPETVKVLLEYRQSHPACGMVAAITTDEQGTINFPYNHVSSSDPEVINTKRSLSFCCTLLSLEFLKNFDLNQLKEDKDWYDVHISKKSRSLGLNNILLKGHPVLHLPHSSRPWKKEKYSNPISYYFKKLFLKRDRI